MGLLFSLEKAIYECNIIDLSIHSCVVPFGLKCCFGVFCISSSLFTFPSFPYGNLHERYLYLHTRYVYTSALKRDHCFQNKQNS